MKWKATTKDFYRMILRSPGRFLSILFIVALGVAFFSGIRSGEPDMRLTGDAYFDSEELMDIRVMGSYGMTKEDLRAFEQLDVVEKAEGGYSADFLCERDDQQTVLHVMSILPTMNKVKVSQGRMPEKTDECLADSAMKYQVGDVIELISGNEDQVTDTLKTAKLKVVGIGSVPNYISYSRGNSLIGTGAVSGFLIVPEDTFDLEVYTECCIRVKGAKEKQAYSAEYDHLVEEALEYVEEEADIRGRLRKDEIVSDARKEVEDARKKLEEERRKVQEELKKAEDLIQKAQEELTAAQNEIDSGEYQLNHAIAQLTNSQAELERKKAEYYQGKEEFEDQKWASLAEIQEGREQMEALLTQISADENTLVQVAAAINEKTAAGAPEEEVGALREQQAMLKQKIEGQKQAYASTTERLDDAQDQINETENMLQESEQQIAYGQSSIDAGWAEVWQRDLELKNGKALLAENTTRLDTSRKEYEEGKQEGEEKLAEGEKEILEAEEEIEKIKNPEWYVDDRGALPEYDGLGDNAKRIRGVGRVFPVLFFLVAALISLTSMTRMVEEQRITIGTMKALGYGKLTVTFKYIGYAFLASALGSIIGVLVGEKVIPYIIVYAYGILYHNMKEIVIPYNLFFGGTASLIAIACTTGATFLACANVMRAQPSVLMRPPAPKIGKRVFLERIGFLWKRLNFTRKSTVRNLARYKKRLLMTVFGIGGCMSLLLLGFGLKDSIYEIAGLQYSKLQLYDGTVYIKDEASDEDVAGLLSYMERADGIEERMPASFKQVTAVRGEEEVEAYECVVESIERSEAFFTFRDRRTKDIYKLGNEGVIISEKTAKMLGVGRGGEIEIKDAGNKKARVTVAEICENYMGHFLYFTPEYYQKAYGRSAKYNSVLFICDEGLSKTQVENVGAEIMRRDEVMSVGYTHDVEKQLNDMLKSLNLVIVVLIVSAGMLSFVVLYNLNNINITERKRELATLKVLGFYDMEVAEYVYRENLILTLMGAVMGIVLGRMLHMYTIQTVEVDAAMFGRVINVPSYIYSLVLTCAFSVFVNGVMYFKLRKVDMVESLKSIE